MITPERWLLLEVRTGDPDLQPLLTEVLLALGGAAVEERGGRLATYLLPPEDPEAFASAAEALLRDTLPPGEAPEVSWRWQADEDWARRWKRGLAPRKLTERLVVKPTWTHWDAAPGEIVLEVDPQMAFGTGEHATTRGCLRLLDRVLRPADRVLDVGSGSGVLSIAAVLLGAAEAVAVEFDADANLNARENLERNGVENRVRLVERSADAALLGELGRFDLVLANILSGTIRPLLPAFRATLGEGGRLIVSGILREESGAVLQDAAAAGLRLAMVDEEEEWWSALLVPTP